jgi:hypothetical protein
MPAGGAGTEHPAAGDGEPATGADLTGDRGDGKPITRAFCGMSSGWRRRVKKH